VGMSRGQGRWAGVESDSDDHPQAPPLQSSSSSSLSIEKVLNDDVDEDIISISDHSVGPEGWSSSDCNCSTPRHPGHLHRHSSNESESDGGWEMVLDETITVVATAALEGDEE
jgi:hypothetical protein